MADLGPLCTWCNGPCRWRGQDEDAHDYREEALAARKVIRAMLERNSAGFLEYNEFMALAEHLRKYDSDTNNGKE